jgi:hypothetical protein
LNALACLVLLMHLSVYQCQPHGMRYILLLHLHFKLFLPQSSSLCYMQLWVHTLPNFSLFSLC